MAFVVPLWCNIRYPRSFPSMPLSYIDLVAHASDSTEGFATHTHPGRSFPHSPLFGFADGSPFPFLKNCTCVVAWVYAYIPRGTPTRLNGSFYTNTRVRAVVQVSLLLVSGELGKSGGF